jgi:hypothetical protein
MPSTGIYKFGIIAAYVTLKVCSYYYYYYYYYYLTAIGLTLGGSSTVHIYTQTSTQNTEDGTYIIITKKKIGKQIGKCGPCPVLASYILAFALQLRKKHGKTSVRVVMCSNNALQ